VPSKAMPSTDPRTDFPIKLPALEAAL